MIRPKASLRTTCLASSLFFAARMAQTAEGATSDPPGVGDPTLAAVKKALPPEDANRSITVAGRADGHLLALQNRGVTVTGPAVALLVNVEEKSTDSHDVRWSPHLFVTATKGGDIEILAHQELSAMRYDFDSSLDKGSKLSLGTLPLTKDAIGLLVTLRKVEGTEKSASIEEMVAIYVVHKNSFALAFSQRVESSTAEVVDGVKQISQEVTKVELGKKATGKLMDLMLTTKRVEKKGDQTNESKPAVDHWCWNDTSGIYMPECK